MGELLVGATFVEFVFMTVIVFGAGAFMMGRALADTWRPAWQNVVYGLLLAVGNRLFMNFFFAENVLSVQGYVVAALVLIGIALLAYRATKAYKMVNQYPWLYRRDGLFAWQKISDDSGA